MLPSFGDNDGHGASVSSTAKVKRSSEWLHLVRRVPSLQARWMSTQRKVWNWFLDVAEDCDGSDRRVLIDLQDFEDKLALVERWVQSTVVDFFFAGLGERGWRADPLTCLLFLVSVSLGVGLVDPCCGP